MKKTKQPLLYALCSAVSFVVDIGAFYLLSLLFGPLLGGASETVCNLAARVISSFFNFNANRRLVFGNAVPYGKSLLRYYCLAIPQAAASTLLLNLFVWLFKSQTPETATLIKIVVDSCLFVISFFIQKLWVFSSGKGERE